MQGPQEIQRKAHDKLARLKQDYEDLFSSPVGQRVLQDIRLSAGIEREIFSENHASMALNEGKRQLGIHITYMATPKPTHRPEEAKT